MTQQICQCAVDGACREQATHEIVIGGALTGVRMSGPHARLAVEQYMTQGETSVSMQQIGLYGRADQ